MIKLWNKLWELYLLGIWGDASSKRAVAPFIINRGPTLAWLCVQNGSNTPWPWKQSFTHRWLSQQNLLQAWDCQQCLYNRASRPWQFKLVLVLFPSFSSKLLTKWQRTFMVRWKVGNANYILTGVEQHKCTILTFWKLGGSECLWNSELHDRQRWVVVWGTRFKLFHLTPLSWPSHNSPERTCCSFATVVCWCVLQPCHATPH